MSSKNVVPIVFSFDDNLVMQAGVCMTSLLHHAKPETFYDIFILHDSEAKFPSSRILEKLFLQFSEFSIQYVNVGSDFRDAFQIRGITQATYYRLLIPDLIPQYDKIMYHDVDVIFRDDLSSIYFDTDLTGYYVAGVSTPYAASDRITVIREENGMRKKIIVDIEKQAIFDSPAYYLKQNDVVFIEPKDDESTPKEERTWRLISFGLGLVTVVLTVLNFVR